MQGYQRIRKAQPAVQDVHVSRPLTNISVAYIQDQSQYSASDIFPVVPVNKKSDQYYIYTRADFLRDEAEERAPATESAGGGYGLSTASYACTTFAYHKDVDDETRANSDAGLNPDRDATEFVTQKMLIRREKNWIDTYWGTSIWGTDIDIDSASTNWFTISTAAYSGSPLSDIQIGVRKIQSSTGFKPNLLVMTPDVWDVLRLHTDVLERIKYTSRDSVSLEAFAALVELPRVIVLESVFNSAVEEAAGGEATDFTVNSGGFNEALALFHVARRPGLLTPSAGYTFTWNGLLGSNARTGMAMSKMRMGQIKSDRIEGEMSWDQKIVSNDLGYFMHNTIVAS
jgi:hypothetical protein